MSVLAHESLKRRSGEARCPDRPPDADVHEDRRLEPPAGFNRIDSLNKLGRVVAPAVVAPGEEGGRHSQGLMPRFVMGQGVEDDPPEPR